MNPISYFRQVAADKRALLDGDREHRGAEMFDPPAYTAGYADGMEAAAEYLALLPPTPTLSAGDAVVIDGRTYTLASVGTQRAELRRTNELETT